MAAARSLDLRPPKQFVSIFMEIIMCHLIRYDWVLPCCSLPLPPSWSQREKKKKKSFFYYFPCESHLHESRMERNNISRQLGRHKERQRNCFNKHETKGTKNEQKIHLFFKELFFSKVLSSEGRTYFKKFTFFLNFKRPFDF